MWLSQRLEETDCLPEYKGPLGRELVRIDDGDVAVAADGVVEKDWDAMTLDGLLEAPAVQRFVLIENEEVEEGTFWRTRESSYSRRDGFQAVEFEEYGSH